MITPEDEAKKIIDFLPDDCTDDGTIRSIYVKTRID